MFEKDKIIEEKDDKITNLRNKVEDLEKEREKLKEENKSLVFKGMYFDIFKIEMREKYGHIEEDSDDDEDLEGNVANDQTEGSNQIKQVFQCDQCNFIGKTESGLKTHKTFKHKGKSVS